MLDAADAVAVVDDDNDAGTGIINASTLLFVDNVAVVATSKKNDRLKFMLALVFGVCG